MAYDPRYQNAADLVLEQSIRNLPLHPAASSAFTWRWNPQTDQLERVDDMVSPLFSASADARPWPAERRRHVGYYRVEDADGSPLGVDPVPLSVQGAPIQYRARTELTYSVSTFNFTYGVRDDLDVNVAIPIVTLDMDLGASRAGASPVLHGAHRDRSGRIGRPVRDSLVRAKWRFYDGTWDGGPMAAAVGVRFRIPTGDRSRGLGTGYGGSDPTRRSRRPDPGWLDTHLDAGIDAVINTLAAQRGALQLGARSACATWSGIGGRGWRSTSRSSAVATSRPGGRRRRCRGRTQRPAESPTCRISGSRRAGGTTPTRRSGCGCSSWSRSVLSLGVFKSLNCGRRAGGRLEPGRVLRGDVLSRLCERRERQPYRTRCGASCARCTRDGDQPRLDRRPVGRRPGASAEEKAAMCARIMARAEPAARTRLAALGSEQAVIDIALRRHPSYPGVVVALALRRGRTCRRGGKGRSAVRAARRGVRQLHRPAAPLRERPDHLRGRPSGESGDETPATRGVRRRGARQRAVRRRRPERRASGRCAGARRVFSHGVRVLLVARRHDLPDTRGERRHARRHRGGGCTRERAAVHWLPVTTERVSGFPHFEQMRVDRAAVRRRA